MAALSSRVSKVLVANRGEIAVRIGRTLRELGIPWVAVHSDPDKEALHVRTADAAVSLGGERASESYLDPAKLLAAAKATGCDAVHPGYGFLSQDAAFVRACEAAGLCFLGPDASAMEALGNKRASRALAEKLGVPVVLGRRDVETPEHASAVAIELGFPVLLKAAAGGGGRGMRRVDRAADLAEAWHAARREAKAAFGDDAMIVEKLVAPARHVEVQVLGDGKAAVALGERECSLQRRYQKIVEESPSVAVDTALRAALFAAAVKLSVAVGYRSAGTVEFLVGPDGKFHFLEMNTRIQVEHPVTELRSGLDLVRAQVEIARGGPLPAAPVPTGHSIEVRLNAEDPGAGFLPGAGKILRLRWPQRPGLRIDSGVREGDVVSPHYDSLLAKLIVHAPDREQARRRLLEVLRELVLLGVPTNQSFLIDLLSSEDFSRGRTYTSTIEDQPWKEPEPPAASMQAAALAARGSAPAGEASPSPWRTLGGWRIDA